YCIFCFINSTYLDLCSLLSFPTRRSSDLAAEHLGEPVVQRGQVRHHRPAHHDEVEVRDDEVGVVPVHVERRAGLRHAGHPADAEDRKSTRLNSSHVKISYAVFCLKKKINL